MNTRAATERDVATLPDAAAYERALEGIVGIPFTPGNRLDVLKNGCRIFPAMLEAVVNARHSIDFLTFIYWQGDIADKFGHALAERAEAGVRVRILLDAFGASSMPKAVLERMTASGCEIAWFRPVARWRFWQVDNRTHRKILVCDNRVGFTGGVGIASEWDGDARTPDEWRETHFRIEGPALGGLRGAFLSNWVEAGRSGFYDAWRLPEAGTPGEARIQVLRTSAAVNYSDIATLLRLLLTLAQRELFITTAYFVPDGYTIDLLCEAVRRGVDVQILMPGPHTDSQVSQTASEDSFQDLLAAGVKLYRFQPTMLHAKVVLVDGIVACSGSANFNQRSMGKDDEIALCMIHEPTVSQLVADFEGDRARCEQVQPGVWRRRGLWQRFTELASRLFRSQT